MAFPRGEWTLRHGLRGHPTEGDGYGAADDADERLSIIHGLLGALTAVGGEGQYAGTALSTGANMPAGEWVILDDSGFPHFRKTTTNTAITFVASSGSQDLYAIITLQAGASPDLIDEGLTQITFQTVLAGNPAPANHALKLGTGAVTASAFTSFTYDTGIYRTNRWNVGSAASSIKGQLHIYDGGSDNNPGLLALYDDAGNDYYLWVDTAGNLRFHTAAPVDDDTDGVIITTATVLAAWTGSANVVTVGTLSSGDATAVVSAASDTAAGKVELATAAETTTGTDATRAVTPDGLAGSGYGKRVIYIAAVPFDVTLTTGDGKMYYTVPQEFNGWNIIAAHAAIYTVSSSGLPLIQVHNLTDAQDILSTRITIDVGEYSSYTADAPPVINASYDDLATGDRLRIDVDAAGTGTQGLDIILTVQLP